MRPAWKTEASLLFVVLVWGFNFPLIKAVLGVMPAHTMNFFRLTSSLLTLGVIGWYRSRGKSRSRMQALRLRPVPILALGLLGYFVYQVSFIVGMDHTAAGSAAIIMASVPVWSALIGHGFRYERLPRTAWVGLVICLSGAVLIVVTGANEVDFGQEALFGNTIILLAALCWGAYTAFNRPLLRHVTPLELNLYGLAISLPFLFLTASPSFPAVQWGRLSLWVWAAIVISGGLSTGLATLLWSGAVRDVGAAQTAAYGNLVPFVALFSSFFFLDEPLHPLQVSGGVLIIGGLFVMQRARRRLRRV